MNGLDVNSTVQLHDLLKMQTTKSVILDPFYTKLYSISIKLSQKFLYKNPC